MGTGTVGVYEKRQGSGLPKYKAIFHKLKLSSDLQ